MITYQAVEQFTPLFFERTLDGVIPCVARGVNKETYISGRTKELTNFDAGL